MSNAKAIKRVMIARSVAKSWLSSQTVPEYRMRVFYGAKDLRFAVGLLKSFRDNSLKVGGVDPIPDLGIAEGSDYFEIWSSDVNGLRALKEWFEKRGCETIGVW